MLLKINVGAHVTVFLFCFESWKSCYCTADTPSNQHILALKKYVWNTLQIMYRTCSLAY